MERKVKCVPLFEAIAQGKAQIISRDEYKAMLDVGYKFRGASLYECAPIDDFIRVQFLSTSITVEPKRIMKRPI